MIAAIQGEVIGLGDDHLILLVGGIGIRVFTPVEICTKGRIGENYFLHTHLVVREDVLNLYGFLLEEERKFFTLLLGVNGVGPRVSLAILSSLSIDAIRRAVLGEQAEIFSRVPGVGKKTSQKILLHLQGRVEGDLEKLGVPILDVDTEVLDALTSLGYSVVEAQAALQSIPRDGPTDLESRLRLALQYFTG
jgi:holliday junction DNA helicase RuvA